MTKRHTEELPFDCDCEKSSSAWRDDLFRRARAVYEEEGQRLSHLVHPPLGPHNPHRCGRGAIVTAVRSSFETIPSADREQPSRSLTTSLLHQDRLGPSKQFTMPGDQEINLESEEAHEPSRMVIDRWRYSDESQITPVPPYGIDTWKPSTGSSLPPDPLYIIWDRRMMRLPAGPFPAKADLDATQPPGGREQETPPGRTGKGHKLKRFDRVGPQRPVVVEHIAVSTSTLALFRSK